MNAQGFWTAGWHTRFDLIDRSVVETIGSAGWIPDRRNQGGSSNNFRCAHRNDRSGNLA